MQTVDDDERLIKLDSHVSEPLGAMQLCLDKNYVIPSMILLYAATDGMAWLYRIHDKESNGQDFKEWVNRFWIDQAGGITSTDLWAARCSLLHEQSSNSRDTRSGKARPLFYYSGRGKSEIPLGAHWRETPIGVRPQEMIAAFKKAVARFRIFILESERKEQILSRCGEWFDPIRPNSYFKYDPAAPVEQDE
jgi:hypothetical protein